jgi:hypothetical protein
MRRFAWVALALISLRLAGATSAQAEKRVAVAIGNSAYQHTSKLTNPKNDATNMAAVLKKHGFQVIDGWHTLATLRSPQTHLALQPTI